MSDLIQRLNRHALPDPHDEREVLHAPLLREAAAEIERLELERDQIKAALRMIAYEPFGHPEASHRDVLDEITEFARSVYEGKYSALAPEQSAERQRDEAIAALRELMDGQDDGGSEATQRFEAAWESARRLLNQKEGT